MSNTVPFLLSLTDFYLDSVPYFCVTLFYKRGYVLDFISEIYNNTYMITKIFVWISAQFLAVTGTGIQRFCSVTDL